jgi:hypothetical protein
VSKNSLGLTLENLPATFAGNQGDDIRRLRNTLGKLWVELRYRSDL